MTDVGVVRDHNEDAALVDERADFFVVADGMGGHAAGEVASAMAVETINEELSQARDEIASFAGEPTDRGRKELVSILEAAVRKAHNEVYTRGVKEPDKQGMGTTLDVVLLAGPEAFVAHVGDSRTYLIRDGKAAQITTDHTVAEVLVIEGKLSLEEAQVSPLRTILVNAIGVAPDVGVEMAHVRLRKDDLLLLCSDGLHDYFPAEQELADHVVGVTPDKALNKVVELAKSRGGHDNITGILVEVLEAPPDEPTSSPFETDLTQPATNNVSDGVPEPIASGDTQPHDIGSEDTDKSAPTPHEDEDIKTTLPLRPMKVRAATEDTEEIPKYDPTDAELAEPSERAKLARASTEPPIPADGDDEPDDDDEALTEEAVAVAEAVEADAEKTAKARPGAGEKKPEAKTEADGEKAEVKSDADGEKKTAETSSNSNSKKSSSKKRKSRKRRRKKKRAKKSS